MEKSTGDGLQMRTHEAGVRGRGQGRGRVYSPVDGEEQGEGGDRLLAPGQVVHRPESLAGRHAVVVDAVEVRLLGILRPEERLRALVLGQRLDNSGDDRLKDRKRQGDRGMTTGRQRNACALWFLVSA